jgi:hypothetical protein
MTQLFFSFAVYGYQEGQVEYKGPSVVDQFLDYYRDQQMKYQKTSYQEGQVGFQEPGSGLSVVSLTSGL